MTSTFWGLRLEPGKRYSTTVDKSFHVSMAALDCTTVKNDKDIHCVMLEEGDSNLPFILCNLQKPKILQARLNLNFESGDRITFFCKGSGIVHLTGYINPEEDDFAQFGEDGEEVEEEEEEIEEEEEEDEKEVSPDKSKNKNVKQNGLAGKRKGESVKGQAAKKKKQEEIEQESGDSDEDEDDEEEIDAEEESGNSDEEDEEMVAESDDESETEIPVVEKKLPEQPGKKKKKKNKQSPQAQQPSGQQQGKQKQQNAIPNGAQPTLSAAQQKKKPQQQQSNEKSGLEKKVLEGGVSVQDTKIGNGPVCKPGKLATVYYTGKLKSNNKVFDQTTQGPGFKFRVGRGEVIKGWDVGLTGMKVGGKRLITCPPHMGYGQKGMPPTIPGNSSLVFEVELKSVN